MTATDTTPMTSADEPSNDATRSSAELFRYSAWVHVGLGVEDCADAETGACGDPLHFHAWVRLPNQFQHQDIRERALAAKARRMRQLRDPNTDAYEILESDMAELQRDGDRTALIDELVAKDDWKRQGEALRDLDELDEYEHIDRDRERIRELRAMPEDERPADEFAELERHFATYGEKLEARITELEGPIRSALDGMEMGELVEQVREERIAAEGSAAFMETYTLWQWLAGTYTHRDALARKRHFDTPTELENAAPEVVEALRMAFAELEVSMTRGATGNS